MKLAAVRFTERITIPRVTTSQSFTTDAKRGVAIDFSASSRVIYLTLTPRSGGRVVCCVPLERVLSFEPMPEEKEASAKGA